MNREDYKIVDSVDILERERIRHQTRIQELRHLRRSRWIKALLIVGVVSSGLGFGLPVVIHQWELRAERIAAENARKKQELEVMEATWQQCIVTMGLHACTLIEKRAAMACYHHRHHDKTYECLERRLETP